jgi:hypothetical protein
MQQTNNKILTALNLALYDLCRVIDWLFIIMVLVSKKNVCVYDAGIFFYLYPPKKERTVLLKAIGCSTFTTCPQFSITTNLEDL